VAVPFQIAPMAPSDWDSDSFMIEEAITSSLVQYHVIVMVQLPACQTPAQDLQSGPTFYRERT
jgi:hypothetical protein